ncbi:cbb3-type cytochrome oxidase assembly protein CcoS [Maliponia aquimaris]|uniref:Cytochrome oxidase maturation protein cbb3-type n=1 Tax=Maliponia aquimaris TaxID=1673631 RepID=A0A238L1P9_9RHOB|nr:cbb3-type cytochrome oxidase assembly protein CcoS [Maliponia aquimaris]SMX48790.1 Cytochrome oxidase maturation protein cbb3-type [Maliponia aquimaris]
MTGALFLIPVAIGMGLIGLAAFFWSLRHDQYDDPDGDARRILTAPDTPANPTQKETSHG